MPAGGSPIHEAVNCQLCPVLSVVPLRIRLGTCARRVQLSTFKSKFLSGLPSAPGGRIYKPFSHRGAPPSASLTREKISLSYRSPARIVREYRDLKIILIVWKGLTATRTRTFRCTPSRKSFLTL